MSSVTIEGNRVMQAGESRGLLKIKAEAIYYRGNRLDGGWVQVLTRSSEREWLSLDGQRVLWASAVDGFDRGGA